MPTSLESLSGIAYWRAVAESTASSWRDAFGRGVGRNIAAGVTVALVALPLNLALALACGLPASVGLVTGAIAGVLGAMFGGSRFQITGPEVALAPITFEIVSRHGFEGLILATMIAGVIQIALGLLRVGGLVRAIPLPVIGGFLAAVGILVFDSQLPRLLGLPADVRLISDMSMSSFAAIDPRVVLIGLLVIVVMVALPRVNKRIPAPLAALAIAVAALGIGWTIPTVAPLDSSWPSPRLPVIANVDVVALLPEAIALAIIASIDSLLCAVSIDTRVGGPRTQTDQELVAQGIANIASAGFGGMPVAAAVVRSAAAIEAGATSRLAPLMQSLVLALVVLVLAPLVSYIPLVALASILLVVGWRLIEWRLLYKMWRLARFEAVIFIVTAAGILLTDFVMGVLIGVAASLAHFAHEQREFVSATCLETSPTTTEVATCDGRAQIIWLTGPLFFGSQAKLDEVIDELDERDVDDVVIELSAVPTIDISGAGALVQAIERLAVSGEIRVWVSGVGDRGTPLVRLLLRPELAKVHLIENLEDAELGLEFDPETSPLPTLPRRELPPIEDQDHAIYSQQKRAANQI
ncbi:MAG: SulP family inorganic anion transporter [Enhygromyxa sp.]